MHSHLPLLFQGPCYINFDRFPVDHTKVEEEFSGWDQDFWFGTRADYAFADYAKNDNVKHCLPNIPVAMENKRANWPKNDEELLGQDVQTSCFSVFCGARWSNVTLLTD